MSSVRRSSCFPTSLTRSHAHARRARKHRSCDVASNYVRERFGLAARAAALTSYCSSRASCIGRHYEFVIFVQRHQVLLRLVQRTIPFQNAQNLAYSLGGCEEGNRGKCHRSHAYCGKRRQSFVLFAGGLERVAKCGPLTFRSTRLMPSIGIDALRFGHVDPCVNEALTTFNCGIFAFD